MTDDSQLVQMARLQGEGIVKWWEGGIHELFCMKDGGIWKIKRLHYNLTFRTPYEEGWLNVPVIGQHGPDLNIPPDEPPTAYHPYPSGYQVPFSFKHPVTRK